MSETLDSNETPNTSKYFCHSCSSSFFSAVIAENFECPNCQSGFIEEILQNTIDTEQESDNPQFHRVLNDLTRVNPVSQSGNNIRPSYWDLNREFYSNTNDSTDLGRNQSQRRLGPVNFENILQEILVLISDGASSSENATAPMFFLGNPGDYAWGREGLDSIVTQLLNQMDNAGPPPLGKDKIAEIPKVEVTQNQVEKEKLQCSVCWDDFKLNEIVRKLTCTHIFHESCIIPWLELHGTCPICRKSLNSEHIDCNAVSLSEQTQVNNLESDLANYYRHLESNAAPNASTSQNLTYPFRTVSNSNQIPVPEQDDLYTDSTLNNVSEDVDEDNGSNNSRITRNSRRHDDGNIDFDFD